MHSWHRQTLMYQSRQITACTVQSSFPSLSWFIVWKRKSTMARMGSALHGSTRAVDYSCSFLFCAPAVLFYMRTVSDIREMQKLGCRMVKMWFEELYEMWKRHKGRMVLWQAEDLLWSGAMKLWNTCVCMRWHELERTFVIQKTNPTKQKTSKSFGKKNELSIACWSEGRVTIMLFVRWEKRD